MVRRMLKTALLPALASLVLVAARSPAQTRDPEAGDDTQHAWLGLYIRNLDRDDAKALDLETGTEGVVVSGVDDEGPAAHVGLEAGDVVTELDGKPVRDQAAFARAVQEHRPADRVKLSVLRDGKSRTFEVQLQSRPAASDVESPRARSSPRAFPWSNRHLLEVRPRLGIEILGLGAADLARHFGVKAGEGVLVTNVEEKSGAAYAGVKPGDVILRLNDRKVGDPEDLYDELARHESGDSVDVVLKRDDRERKLRVELSSGGLQTSAFSFALPRDDAHRGDVESLQRDLRELRRQLDELKNEMRDLRRR